MQVIQYNTLVHACSANTKWTKYFDTVRYFRIVNCKGLADSRLSCLSHSPLLNFVISSAAQPNFLIWHEPKLHLYLISAKVTPNPILSHALKIKINYSIGARGSKHSRRTLVTNDIFHWLKFLKGNSKNINVLRLCWQLEPADTLHLGWVKLNNGKVLFRMNHAVCGVTQTRNRQHDLLEMLPLVSIGVICWLFEPTELIVVILADYLSNREFYAHQTVNSRPHWLARYLILDVLNKLFPLHSAVVVDIHFFKQSDRALNKF